MYHVYIQKAGLAIELVHVTFLKHKQRGKGIFIKKYYKFILLLSEYSIRDVSKHF